MMHESCPLSLAHAPLQPPFQNILVGLVRGVRHVPTGYGDHTPSDVRGAHEVRCDILRGELPRRDVGVRE